MWQQLEMGKLCYIIIIIITLSSRIFSWLQFLASVHSRSNVYVVNLACFGGGLPGCWVRSRLRCWSLTLCQGKLGGSWGWEKVGLERMDKGWGLRGGLTLLASLGRPGAGLHCWQYLDHWSGAIGWSKGWRCCWHIMWGVSNVAEAQGKQWACNNTNIFWSKKRLWYWEIRDHNRQASSRFGLWEQIQPDKFFPIPCPLFIK